MSVRGEFRRAVGDAVAALRVAQAYPLADRLERACDPDAAELSAVADAVLADIASARRAGVAPVADEVEHLAALCRVILGR